MSVQFFLLIIRLLILGVLIDNFRFGFLDWGILDSGFLDSGFLDLGILDKNLSTFAHTSETNVLIINYTLIKHYCCTTLVLFFSHTSELIKTVI